jgi:RHS repeat-associated protein
VQDYYAFGMQMPGRKLSGGYRYGFNGKENDNEVKGEGNQQDYGMRIYDGRIGKFLSVDPKAKLAPDWTPYRFGFNDPIRYTDPDGLWEWDAVGNLKAQKGDNSYTMAKFLGTSQSNAMQMLNRGGVTANAKGVLNLREGQSFSNDNLWVGTKSASGPVVNNTKAATVHYFNGKGAAADVGDQSTRELLSSPKFNEKHTKITTQKVQAEGNFSVDLTSSTFHIGSTNVDYSVSGNGKSSSVTYNLFSRDGFWDPDFVDEKVDKFVRDKIGFSPFGLSMIPDQKGPNLERGGTPYDYKTRERTYFFKPVEEKK